jgi:hypothetical protein
MDGERRGRAHPRHGPRLKIKKPEPRPKCVVNLGDDTHTTGAAYGQLTGACYRERAIPIAWRIDLAEVELIGSFAEKLFALALR